MRIQESEYRIQKKNNTMVILAPIFSCFVVPVPGMAVRSKINLDFPIICDRGREYGGRGDRGRRTRAIFLVSAA